MKEVNIKKQPFTITGTGSILAIPSLFLFASISMHPGPSICEKCTTWFKS